MKVRDVFDLVTLGMLWGVSFLFIRVAAPEFGAVALIEVRVLLAAVILLPLVAARKQLGELLANWKPIALMGVLHYALPFCLYAYAMLTLSAGYSSIINAAAPLFAAAVARVWLGDRLDSSRLAGLVIGFSGVALLAWGKLGSANALAIAATLGAAFCYGFAAVMAKRSLAGVAPMAVAGGSMAAAALVLLPLTFFLWPEQAPTTEAWGMVVVLGIACTALAFVLYFRLIASAGPSNAITVTYLIPVFAVAAGVVFLDESVTTSMLVGGVVIAVGTALATGLLQLSKLVRFGKAAVVRSVLVIAVYSALDDTPPDVYAAELNTPVYISANTFSYEESGHWDSFSTLALAGEIEVISDDRRKVFSLFAENHRSGDSRVDGTTLAGALLGYRAARWDVTGFYYATRFPRTASRPTMMVRGRHLVTDGHKLGLEYMAYMDALEEGELKLGYYGSITQSLSMKLLIGSVVSEATPVARLELSWQLH